MNWSELYSIIAHDKHLFALKDYALITAFDDFLFLQNDYDTLNPGQRRYLVRTLEPHGFKQTRGTLITDGELKLHFQKPKVLAQSSFKAEMLEFDGQNFQLVTPTTFAEAMFYDVERHGEEAQMTKIAELINTAPFNMKLLRDITHHSPIEMLTRRYYQSILDYQKDIIANKFEKKRSLK